MLIERRTREDPATDRQVVTITRLCMALGIREPLEERKYTVGQAGMQIRALLTQLRLKKGGKR